MILVARSVAECWQIEKVKLLFSTRSQSQFRDKFMHTLLVTDNGMSWNVGSHCATCNTEGVTNIFVWRQSRLTTHSKISFFSFTTTMTTSSVAGCISLATTVASLATADNEVVGAALSADARSHTGRIVAMFLGHDDEETGRFAATVSQTLSADRLPTTETIWFAKITLVACFRR